MREELEEKWLFMYNLAKDYYEKYGDLLIPTGYVKKTKDGKEYKLGNWIRTQRERYKNQILSEERLKLLNEIGMVWDVRKYGISLAYQKRKQRIENDSLDLRSVCNKEINLNCIIHSDKYDQSTKTYIKWINDIKMPSTKEMEELLEKISNGDKKAKEIIIRCYLKYVVRVAMFYFSEEKDFIDYIQTANVYLIRAVDLYTEKKDFHNQLSMYLQNMLLKYKKREPKYNPYLIPIDYIENKQEKELKIYLSGCEKEFFENIRHILIPREYEIICIEFNYNSELNINELAEKYNISRERIRQLRNSALKKIKDYVENYDKHVPYYNFNARNFYDLFYGFNKYYIKIALNNISKKHINILYKVHGPELLYPLSEYIFTSNVEYNSYKNTLIELECFLKGEDPKDKKSLKKIKIEKNGEIVKKTSKIIETETEKTEILEVLSEEEPEVNTNITTMENEFYLRLNELLNTYSIQQLFSKDELLLTIMNYKINNPALTSDIIAKLVGVPESCVVDYINYGISKIKEYINQQVEGYFYRYIDNDFENAQVITKGNI